MNLGKRIGLLGNLAAALLVICSLRIVYWQMIRGDALLPVWLNPFPINAGTGGANVPVDLNQLPQPAFQRVTTFLKRVMRGSIYDRTGRLLATDQTGNNGDLTRSYTEPSLASIVGYTSRYRTGLNGLELTENVTLLGLDRLDSRLAQLLHQPIVGNSLRLTIDSDLQRAADAQLSGKAGAVIIMDAHSGAILAMASAPHFDPNRILENGYAANLVASCSGAPACSAPFINRATQALYPPGSTFKTIMLIAGLDSGQLKADQVFDFGKALTGPTGDYYVYHVNGGGIIPDYNHKQQTLNLEQSFDLSANAAFAQIGDEMPADTLIDYARRFGFSPLDANFLPFELETSIPSLAQNPSELKSNNMLRASTGIGQGELLTTPLNMGMVVLTVENDGNMPLPYLIESTVDPSGKITAGISHPQVHKSVIKPETASTVRQMMISVVKNGTGLSAAVPGLVVGGKTGTAQLGGSAQPHAWFIGFAEGKERSVVIVVVVENGGEGSAAAAPIFAKLANLAVRIPSNPTLK
jgi:penicillin-binding protein A